MPHLPDRWATHLVSGVTHRLGACGPGGRPELCRALAARSCPDGCIEVLLAADVGRHVIAAVQANRRVAHVAAQPATSVALQLKGLDAEVLPARPQHLELLAQARDALLAALPRHGVRMAQIRDVWYDAELPLLRCLRYTPGEATNQTPGPGAGPIELLP